MRRWISEIAANARSIARCAAGAGVPRTRIATQVPRSGRARSMLGWGEHQRISCEQSPHAVSDMAAGERRSRNILDVGVQLQSRTVLFADELAPPGRQMHFAPVA